MKTGRLVFTMSTIVLYWLIAALYMVRPALVHIIPSPLLKSTPILLLAVYSLFLHRKAKSMLILGLVLSACGDVAGDVAGGGFIPQVAFFLMAQCAYLAAFVRDARWNRRRLVMMVPLLIWICFMVSKLVHSSDLGAPVLAVAVGIYLAAITGMAITAILRQAEWWWVVATGALLFVFSDSVIAWSRFVGEWPNSGSIVMWSYYLAQFMIAIGYVSNRKLETSV